MEINKINSQLNFNGVINVAGRSKDVGEVLKHVVKTASKEGIPFRFMSLGSENIGKNFRAYMITTGKEAEILKNSQLNGDDFHKITKKLDFPKGTKSPNQLLRQLESEEIILSTFKKPPFIKRIKMAIERRFLEFTYGVDD